MDAITKLKTGVSLVEHVQKSLWQQGKNDTKGVFFKSWDEKTPSLLVYKENWKWYNDFSDRLWGWSIIDFEMNLHSLEKAEAIKKLCEMYWMQDDDKKEFKKSPKRADLVKNFETYRMKEVCPWFSRFLQIRWVQFDFIQANMDRVKEVAQEFWFAENIWIKDKIYKDVIIFPCYKVDKKWELELCWAKLRTTDWTPFDYKWKELKSVSVGKPYGTGLICKKEDISEKYTLVTEGETDYMIMKLLGYKTCIWNLWGVSAHADEIQKLTKKVDKVVSLYDNDWPWTKATYGLQDKIQRPIRKVLYKEIEGMEKYDINDLFKMGYDKWDFNILIRDSILLDEEMKLEDQPLFQDRFFYNNERLKYFDVKWFEYKQYWDLARHVWLKPKELEEMREAGAIPTYEWVCYLDWGKPWFYNLLDKKDVLAPSDTPALDPNIKFLISNLCWGKPDNIRWLLRTIAYKYHNLNDVFIPAVVFHGVWGTWKWLFMKLLSTIFWDVNTQIGLTQDAINSQFSQYSGQKLVVEFKEVSVESTLKGKKNMNKLKALIMEDKIMVEKKGQDAIPVDNIAWFIMSSNEAKPIHLDSSDSGNRRWSIIRTGKFIPKDEPNEDWISGRSIAEAVQNPETVRNFLAWLNVEYSDVKEISALDNQDKRDLELISESVWNLFFKWLEVKYPHVNKVSNAERDFLLDQYRMEIDEQWFDDRYLIRYFNSWLSIRYKQGKPVVRGKQVRWYFIDKDVNGEGSLPEWLEYDWKIDTWRKDPRDNNINPM